MKLINCSVDFTGMLGDRPWSRTSSLHFSAEGSCRSVLYVDSLLASFLPTWAVSALAYAQTSYSLPVGLFGMSVSASELSAMSSTLGSTEEIAGALRERLAKGLQPIAFFVVPSAIAFVCLGDMGSCHHLSFGAVHW
jgi:putative peptidoglycan lipid II flippase